MTHQTLTYLRKESGDIYNRLHSIEEDIHFVQDVRAAYPSFPIFPNLRCGAWYTDPQHSRQDKDVPVYFKSTDGHFNNWSFNLRRANLHLLPVLKKYGGLILVDSTRSGKRMPDAFSKTVPIWCAVINRAVQGEEEWDTGLYTPPGSVSVQEHEQIEKRIDGWVGRLVASSFDVPRLGFPLRPFWITPGTSTYPTVFERVIPVLCVSASKQVCERRSAGYTYIQGSGDDHELWGMGLDPNKFWKHRRVLLEADRSRLAGLVERIVGEKEMRKGGIEPTPISRVGGLVSIASGSTEDVVGLYRSLEKEKVYIIITSSKGATISTKEDGAPPQTLHLSIPAGKRGQVGLLETVFPHAVEFVRSHMLFRGVLPRICCVCDSGSGFDRSVGVAVVLLQVFFDEEGGVRKGMDEKGNNGTAVPGGDHTRCHRNEGRIAITKESIQKRLEWVISSEARANPARSTLKRVHSYFMSCLGGDQRFNVIGGE